jgi:hypothetical protein
LAAGFILGMEKPVARDIRAKMVRTEKVEAKEEMVVE